MTERTIDEHPLRYSLLAQEIEKVLFRRALQNKLQGYTLETSLEIADAVVELQRARTLERPGTLVES